MASVNPDEQFFNQQQSEQQSAPPTDEALKLEWAEDPGIIGGIHPAQEAFPMEAMGPGLSDLCRSIQRLTGCNPAAAAQASMGSLAVCVQADTDVRLPWNRESGKAVPTSIFLGGLIPTAGRKSSAFSLTFRPHSEADSRIRALHKQTEAEYKAWLASAGKGKGRGKKDPGEVQEAEPSKPLAGPAHILRTNSTMEAIIRDLDQGRDCMALASAEAGSVIDNWSHGRNKSGTVASYNSLWSGESQTLDRTGEGGISRYLGGHQRFSLLFFCQPDYRHWFFDRYTTNGFAGRLLIQCADGWCRRDARAITKEVTPADDTAVREFQRLIADWREEIDEGEHLARADEDDSPRERRVVRFSPEGRQTIADFEEECGARADQLVDCPWPEGFLSRGHEHACRLAANLFAYRQRAGHVGPGDVIDAQSVQDGIALARWFGDEMARIAPEAGAEQLAQDAGDLSRRLWDASVDTEPGDRKNQNGTISISTVVRKHVRRLEKDPKGLSQVLQAVVDADHIAFPKTGKQTQCYVNPNLARLYQAGP